MPHIAGRPPVQSAEYTATMTLGGGHGTHTMNVIFSRASEPADVPTQMRRPKNLLLQPPFKVDGKRQRLCLSLKLLQKRDDGTFGLEEGVHQFRSKYDNGDMIDVRVEKVAIDVAAAAAAAMEM